MRCRKNHMIVLLLHFPLDGFRIAFQRVRMLRFTIFTGVESSTWFTAKICSFFAEIVKLETQMLTLYIP